jgi:hypothetical protein
MKPNELYALPTYTVSHDLGMLAPCSGHTLHVPELEDAAYGFTDQTEITIRVYRDHSFDHRRFWRLASVWLGDRPVMIIRNAGREGTDHHSRFVTDMDAYKDLVSVARKYMTAPERNVEDLVSPDADIPDLTTFYGNSLNGEFEVYLRY